MIAVLEDRNQFYRDAGFWPYRVPDIRINVMERLRPSDWDRLTPDMPVPVRELVFVFDRWLIEGQVALYKES